MRVMNEYEIDCLCIQLLVIIGQFIHIEDDREAVSLIKDFAKQFLFQNFSHSTYFVKNVS